MKRDPKKIMTNREAKDLACEYYLYHAKGRMRTIPLDQMMSLIRFGYCVGWNNAYGEGFEDGISRGRAE